MYLLNKHGHTEILESVHEIQMDISLTNRGKKPIDCEYIIESNPERYKITDAGLEPLTDEELVISGVITAEEAREKKNNIKRESRKKEYARRSDPLLFEYMYDKDEKKRKQWEDEVKKIKSEIPWETE